MTPETLSAIRSRAPNEVAQEYCGDCGGEVITREWAETARDDRRALLAEVERLRVLIKKAEWFGGIGTHDSETGCPWCESDGFYQMSNVGHGKHEPECPAFTEDGEVK